MQNVINIRLARTLPNPLNSENKCCQTPSLDVNMTGIPTFSFCSQLDPFWDRLDRLLACAEPVPDRADPVLDVEESPLDCVAPVLASFFSAGSYGECIESSLKRSEPSDEPDLKLPIPVFMKLKFWGSGLSIF
jgi:hypothetical protein